jgi:hypothetical protein
MGADGFVDNWIKNTIRTDLLANLWNNATLNNLKSIFKVDLVPLNKKIQRKSNSDQLQLNLVYLNF